MSGPLPSARIELGIKSKFGKRKKKEDLSVLRLQSSRQDTPRNEDNLKKGVSAKREEGETAGDPRKLSASRGHQQRARSSSPAR